MLRHRSIKRNIILWASIIAALIILIFLITKDYTLVYIKINNKTALAITRKDTVDEIITRTSHLDTIAGKFEEPKVSDPSVKSVAVVQVKENERTRNEINDVNIYIDHVLNQIMDPIKKEKERKYLSNYFNERTKIIQMLPNVTQQTPVTTFHVLVDFIPKPVSHKYDLIILVSSQVSNYERRTMVRKLWGNAMLSLNKNFKVFFICGGSNRAAHMTAVYKEAQQKKDVIVEDFMESWSDNMGKKVMTALQWVTVNFQYDYILKSDDDVFVDIDAILTRIMDYFVEHPSPSKDVFMGNVMYSQPVERSGRYMISPEEHPAPVFKEYCSGGGYVLSRSLVKKMIPLFIWEHPLRIDDAYIGDRVAAAGSRPIHQNGFMMWNDACVYKNELLVTHPAKNKQCMEKMQKIVTEKKVTDGQTKYKKYPG